MSEKLKTIKCKVVSDKMEKSCVGRIDRLVKDPTTKKYIRRSSKIMFHDEKNEAKIGDFVLVSQTRPMSARKNFRLVSILGK